MANKIMKSTIASVLAIMSVAASVPGTAIGNVIADTAITASANVVSGSFATEELPDGTLCITKFEGTGSVIDIPTEFNGKPITKIGDKAFMGNEYVTEIKYDGDELTSIGEFAFCNCTALKKIYLPNSIETLGRGAFANCSSLTDIRIPAMEAIEEGTFQRCTSLEVFYIPGRVKYIGTGAFQECTNLKEISFCCTTIGKKAFYKCENLSNIDLHGVVDIEDYAFFGCTSLSEIYPAKVKTIGNSAFGSCTALTDLHLMTNGIELTSIGNDAFANCKSLEEVYLHENLTTLGKRAFANCHALKGVRILSEKLTTIPMGAFAATGINFIDIPEGVTSIDGAAFNSCKSLSWVDLPSTLKTIGNSAFATTDITSIDIPEGVTTIDGAAFNNCKSLSRVKLPSTLKTIGAKAFYNSGVKNVTYNSVKSQWNTIEIGEGNDVLASANMYFNSEVVYPTIKNIEYNEQYHQFRVTWTPVEGAQAYGIAYYAAGKWRVATQTIPGSTTTFTSPKLTAGSTHKVVIAAKVNGKWDTSNLSKRAFTVTVK